MIFVPRAYMSDVLSSESNFRTIRSTEELPTYLGSKHINKAWLLNVAVLKEHVRDVHCID